MKKVLTLIAIGLFSTASFAGIASTEKETSIKQEAKEVSVKMAKVDIYCDGVYTGTITCNSCSALDIAEAAQAICD